MEMIGQSTVMQTLRRFIQKVAHRLSTIYIYGKSGTGKELVAKKVHNLSPRRDKVFIAFNCAAVTETLLESELFGHEQNAFNGAAKRIGYFETANGGTLFMDEIGDLPLRSQAKLLRAIQENEIVRVGACKPITIDVRLIVATNKDLEEEARQGRFREDLLYRVNVFRIDVPDLKERKEDIPLLADHFTKVLSKDGDGKEKKVSPEAVKRLMRYDFPGNVRELSNIIERAVILSDGDLILPEHIRLPGESLNTQSAVESVPLDQPNSGNVNKEKLDNALKTAFGDIRFVGLSLADIRTFLLQTGFSVFALRDFAEYIRSKSKKKQGDKKKTAHDYIRKMMSQEILLHNGYKTNKACYYLADMFFIK